MTATEATLFAGSVRRNLAEEVARDLTGRPDAHLAVITSMVLEHDGFDGVKVEMIDAPLCVSGKRKGRPNWRKGTNRRPLIVTWDTWKTAERAWEQRNDACGNCVGTGEEFASWSVADGTTYVPCRKCGATGKPAA